MSTLAVVEDFNVLRDFLPDLVSCFISAVVHELVLQGPPETLHRRVVIAVSPTRPRGFDRHARNTGSHDRSYEKPWCGRLVSRAFISAHPSFLRSRLIRPIPAGNPVITQFRLERLRSVRLAGAPMHILDGPSRSRVFLGPFRGGGGSATHGTHFETPPEPDIGWPADSGGAAPPSVHGLRKVHSGFFKDGDPSEPRPTPVSDVTRLLRAR
jgi:hypothetical protein